MSDNADQYQDLKTRLADIDERIESLESEISELEWERNEVLQSLADPKMKELSEQDRIENIRRVWAEQRLLARYGTKHPPSIRDFFEGLKAFTPSFVDTSRTQS
jgi:septal ring factor EnvC (AmiA/AmiB activator)